MTKAQQTLTALVLEDQLQRLVDCTRAGTPLAVYENLLSYPQDTYDWLIALGLLPATAGKTPNALSLPTNKADKLLKPADQIRALALGPQDYQRAVATLFKARLFWRKGLKFHPTEMIPDPEGAALFKLLADCGLLRKQGKVWVWTEGTKPRLGPIPPPRPPQPPTRAPVVYDSLTPMLKLRFRLALWMGGLQGLARAIRRHRRNGAWHMKGNGFYALDPGDISDLDLARLVIMLGYKKPH
ncbi:hypothetical protein [Tropicibacter oceani]|uniref:Uncharacterized protein n=1 Tax=Tropicibacter oceani TaxID=3058420 RepID=A0ABY8QK25_9RHOB|nr:hypothetical protein [Tropicibacter oceani]WGW04980.1 hypothetical protein QF118_05375 [Tropicibacter oceani]